MLKDTVLNTFMQQVSAHPNNIALEHNSNLLTYQKLNEISDQLCGLLQHYHIKSGDNVPLIAQRTPEFIIGMLAIIKSGANYIPIDANYPEKRIAQLIEKTQSPIILVSNKTIKNINTKDGDNKKIIIIDELSSLKKYPRHAVNISADTLAYVIFTSGTTGTPKGVMISHASLYNLIKWHNEHFNMTPQSRCSFIAGISFDIAQWEIWAALTSGATLCLPSDEARLQADTLLDFIADKQLTHAFIPAIFCREITRLPQPKTLALRYLFTGGEKLSPVDLSNVNYQLIDYYGPTEATIFATCNKVKSSTENPVPSIGKPIAGAEIFILDEYLKPVEGDNIGELYISGPGLAVGYFNDAQMTATRFITSPYLAGKRLYRSGDRACWLADGSVQYHGRTDDQIKIRGNRVELGEIESFMHQVPGVKTAVALVTQPENPADKQIIAFIIADENAPSDLKNKISAHLIKSLPSYFLPAAFEKVASFPINQNGKVDKQALLNSYTGKRQEADNVVIDYQLAGYEVPLAAIWSELLAIKNIAPNDDFFAIGGQSMLAAKLATAIRVKMKIPAYVRDIYNYPTIHQLAAELEKRQKNPVGYEKEQMHVLRNDVRLPDDIQINGQFSKQQLTDPQAIFLTGATGFVGAHLLAEILETTQANVYCITRGESNQEAQNRLAKTLEKYFIKIPQAYFKRIICLVGDLAEPHFGLPDADYQQLANKIDIIYHSASSVNFIQPYAYMKRDNVQGLQEIIRFAAKNRTKPLMLLSTISVYSWRYGLANSREAYEHDDIAKSLASASQDLGYVRSKWVMEKIADLASERGLPVMTFRLGYATLHSKTGVSANYQWWGRLVQTCLQSGTVPYLDELYEGLTSVDYMVSALVHISRNPDGIGKKFNLINEPKNSLSLNAFFKRLEQHFGYQFRIIPYRDWLSEWENNIEAPLYPLLNMFKDPIHDGKSIIELYQQTYLWDNSNAKKFLKNSNIIEPDFNKEMLAMYLQHSIGVKDNNKKAKKAN